MLEKFFADGWKGKTRSFTEKLYQILISFSWGWRSFLSRHILPRFVSRQSAAAEAAIDPKQKKNKSKLIKLEKTMLYGRLEFGDYNRV